MKNTMYDLYEKIRDEKGLRNADVSRGTGISKQILSDWKRGKAVPKLEKIAKIADFLGVSVDYLTTGKEPSYGHYLDPEVADLAQRLHDDENLRILFDCTRDVKKEDLQFVIELIKRMDKDHD